MILERTEHVADRDMHLRAGLDVLEDNQPPILKKVVELSAHGLVLQRLPRDARDPGPERKSFA